MIRIITRRDKIGAPMAWVDYPQVQIDEVTPLLGMRFERDLVALAEDGVDLGVTRWAEVVWRVENFSAAAVEKLVEMIGSPEPTAEQIEIVSGGRTFTQWTLAHPDYLLAARVGIWASINLAGNRALRTDLEIDVEEEHFSPGYMSVRQVMEILERDVTEFPDAPDFLPDQPAGKA